MAKASSHGRDVYVPNDSFSAEVDGVPMAFHKDQTLIREGHPILAKYPHLFVLARMDYEVDIEQATAAPGEKRA